MQELMMYFVMMKITIHMYYVISIKTVIIVQMKVLCQILLVAAVLTKEGYLEEVKAEPVITQEETKLKEITDFVYQQIENCKKDNTVIMNKFEKGEVQPCVKVESDTVHYNLLKVI